MQKLNIGLRILVGLIFLLQGFFKLVGAQNEWRDDLQVAPWFWVVIGIVQLGGAVALFASIRYPWLARAAGALFVFVMTGALATHIRVSDPVSEMILAVILLLASAAIVRLNWDTTPSMLESSGARGSTSGV